MIIIKILDETIENMNNMNFGNMFNNMPASDPTKMDLSQKRMIIQQNMTNSKVGLYKSFPKPQPSFNEFHSTYNPTLDSLFNVSVVYEHSIDAAEKYAMKGTNLSQTNGSCPVIVNTVTKDFIGTSFETSAELRDEMLNLRTNMCSLFGTGNYARESLLSDDKSRCYYSSMVFAIRDKHFNFLPYPNVYRFGMITIAPIDKPKLIKNTKMCCDDYIKTCSLIETIFQTAIAKEHKALILPPFGYLEDENPTDDIIKIYNYCIYKYAHKIGNIIIAIPPYCSKDIFDMYNIGIVRPEIITKDVDIEFDVQEYEDKLLEESSTKKKRSVENQTTPQNFDPNQVQNFMKLMSSNPNMMQMFNQMQSH